MTKKELRKLLEGSPSLSRLFTTLVLEPVPWIFNGDRDRYEEWRRDVAGEAGLGQGSIYLVGSAALGYSLSPYKAARAFKPVVAGERYPSDIDIAIVDAALFSDAWNEIVRNDRRRVLGRMVSEAGHHGPLSSAMAKIRFDIYHGTVTGVYAPPGSEPASCLRTLFAATTRRTPFRGYRPKARLYRRTEDLLAYHEQSLRQLLVVLNSDSKQ